MERTSTRKGHKLSVNKTIGKKSGTHPVLSWRKEPRPRALGFNSETAALTEGVIDSGGALAMEHERNTRRGALGLRPEAGYHHVQTVQNQNEFGNVVTPGEPPEETARRLAREASLNRVRVQPQVRRRRRWYKPWTWLNGGNKLNIKKRKSCKTRKNKTRKNKTRKNKNTKKKLKTRRKHNKIYRGGDDDYKSPEAKIVFNNIDNKRELFIELIRIMNKHFSPAEWDSLCPPLSMYGVEMDIGGLNEKELDIMMNKLSGKTFTKKDFINKICMKSNLLMNTAPPPEGPMAGGPMEPGSGVSGPTMAGGPMEPGSGVSGPTMAGGPMEPGSGVSGPMSPGSGVSRAMTSGPMAPGSGVSRAMTSGPMASVKTVNEPES